MPKMGKGHLPLLYIPNGAGRYAKLPVLTTTQRDALTAVKGMRIFNSTTGQAEDYDGSNWVATGQVIMTTHEADGDAHAQGGHILIAGAAYSAVNAGTWTRQAAGRMLYHRLYNTTQSDLDEVDYQVYLPAGIWTLLLYHGVESGNGILDIDIDGVEVASVDMYASGADGFKFDTTTGIVVATSGLKTLTCRVHGKNVSSSSYYVSISGIELWRTA